MEYDYEENLDQRPTCDYNSTAMNTEEGVSSECYTTVTLDVEDITMKKAIHFVSKFVRDKRLCLHYSPMPTEI